MTVSAVSAPVYRPFDRKKPVWRKRTLEALGLWLVFLLLLAGQSLCVRAAEVEEVADSAGVLMLLDGQGQWQEPATLINSNYAVSVTGLIAETRLRQEFRNTSQQWREGVFVFPLPENASVHDLTMETGDRRIVGEIRPRELARQQYEQARAEGKQAARVEQQRANLFTTHLANIPPGETVVVELQYQQMVSYRSGQFELRLPTTLTPRYLPGKPVEEPSRDWQQGWGVATSEVPDAGEITPFTVRPEDVAENSHRATVMLNIAAGMPVAMVTSPSHELTSTWEGHTVTVTSQADDIIMDRDFVVRWQPVRGAAPTAAVFREHWQGEDYLLAMLVPGLNEGQWLARELVFVIDTSGSMAGESIRQARVALLKGLETLTPRDRFNVIQFDDQPRALFMDTVPADANNLARARRYVEGLEAEGGTEMASALDMALKAAARPTYVRQVVFITDGAVGNEAALFSKIRHQLGNSRLFTVGIGSAPNMHFMREAARFGRGSYTAISDLATLAEPLGELFRKMKAPVLTDIHVQWPGDVAGGDGLPERPGDLFLGEPLIQLSKGQKASGELTVSGRLPDGSRWFSKLDLANAAPGTGIHRVWAREKINGLMDQNLNGQVDEATRAEVTGLAIRHQLITRYTSLVAIDQTPVRAADEDLTREALPTLLPAGSTSGMLQYPATGTIAPLLIALGLVGLMISCAALMLQRRVFP